MNQLLPAFVALGLAASVTPVLAAQVDLSKLPPPAQQENVTYAKDIKPILDASCIRCHGAERPKGGLRLDSLEGALKGGKDGKVLVPGQSTKSKLVIAVTLGSRAFSIYLAAISAACFAAAGVALWAALAMVAA